MIAKIPMEAGRNLIQMSRFVSLSSKPLLSLQPENAEEWTMKVRVRRVTSIPAHAETK